jgi:hypothetical protein
MPRDTANGYLHAVNALILQTRVIIPDDTSSIDAAMILGYYTIDPH